MQDLQAGSRIFWNQDTGLEGPTSLPTAPKPVSRDELIDRLSRWAGAIRKTRVASPLDVFAAAIARFALTVDSLGMYPKKMGQERVPVVSLQVSDPLVGEPLIHATKKSLANNPILRGICNWEIDGDQVVGFLERSDTLNQTLDLISSQHYIKAYNNGRNIKIPPSATVSPHERLLSQFPGGTEVNNFARWVMRDWPVFLMSRVIDIALSDVAADKPDHRRALGQVHESLRTAQIGPEDSLTKWVTARLFLCEVDRKIGSRFHEAADKVNTLRMHLQDRKASFSLPDKSLPSYIEDTVDITEDLYLLGLRDNLWSGLCELTAETFDQRGGTTEHEDVAAVILLAPTSELSEPFNRTQFLKGALTPAFEAIRTSNFDELYTIVFRMALTCPCMVPLASSRRLDLPDELSDMLAWPGRAVLAWRCGLLEGDYQPTYRMSVDRVVAAQLADAVARLEDLRESINPKFSKALETTIKMMRDLIPDFSSEEYTIGSHITALEDQGEEHAEWQREVDESLFLLETLGSKDVTFDVVGQGKRVTVHAGEPGRSKQGVTVPITYTFTDTLRRNKSETLVSKVRAYIAKGAWVNLPSVEGQS